MSHRRRIDPHAARVVRLRSMVAPAENSIDRRAGETGKRFLLRYLCVAPKARMKGEHHGFLTS
jgi:hypothetical protein